MELITCIWVLMALLGTIVVSKIIFPKYSYEIKFSLWVAIGGFIFFAFDCITTMEARISLWPLLSMIICAVYIAKGGKTLALKTMSGVFSKVTKRSVGTMKEGSMNWACPIFEVVTINVDGIPNISADLQKLKITIHETPSMQTAKRGIQAKVKHISFMLKLDGDSISELLDIEGGTETVKERIDDFAKEFFLEQVAKLTPEELDQDKKKTIDHLKDDLEKDVNEFCEENSYPYEIVENSVVIGDTELDSKYYESLAKKEYAKLEQDAKDVEAVALRERIAEFGKHIRPDGTPKEQTDAALISMSIVKKDISEKKYGIDAEAALLAKELAAFFKK